MIAFSLRDLDGKNEEKLVKRIIRQLISRLVFNNAVKRRINVAASSSSFAVFPFNETEANLLAFSLGRENRKTNKRKERKIDFSCRI